MIKHLIALCIFFSLGTCILNYVNTEMKNFDFWPVELIQLSA